MQRRRQPSGSPCRRLRPRACGQPNEPAAARACIALSGGDGSPNKRHWSGDWAGARCACLQERMAMVEPQRFLAASSMVHARPCLGGFAQRDVLSKVGCVKQPTKQARLFLAPLILYHSRIARSRLLERLLAALLQSLPPHSPSILSRGYVPLRGSSATPALFDRRPHPPFPPPPLPCPTARR